MRNEKLFGVSVSLVGQRRRRLNDIGVKPVDLGTWLPAFFVFGLLGLGLMFAFIKGCDKV